MRVFQAIVLSSFQLSSFQWTCRFVFYATCLLLLLSCQKDKSEILQGLEEKIRGGSTKEALSEIQDYLVETNNAHSEFVASIERPYTLTASMSGEVAAWLEQEKLTYYSTDGLYSNETATRPIAFQLSSSGNFISLIFQTGQECRLKIIDTKEHESTERVIQSLCRDAPLISDDGRYLFLPTPKEIRVLAIEPEKEPKPLPGQMKESAPKSISRSVFRKKFPKIAPRLHLRQFGVHGWLAWHGRAGVYGLYFYPGSGKKVLRYKSSLARPYLYTVYDGDTMDFLSPDASKAPSRAPAAYHFSKAQGFVYSGGAGKWKLRAIHFAETIELGKGISAPAWDALQFVRDREEFMALKKQHLYYWNPLQNRKQHLPLLARNFLLFEGGLLYVDLKERLYLRKAPFSEFEIQLVRLRNRIQKKKRSSI